MGLRWYAGRLAADAVEHVRAAGRRQQAIEEALMAAFRAGVPADPEPDGDPDFWTGLDTLLTDPHLHADKSWHGIHRLLTGSTWDTTPGAGEAVLGGEPLIRSDTIASLLPPELVRTVAAALSDLDLDEVASRYDAAVFTAEDIYPRIWDEDDVVQTMALTWEPRLTTRDGAVSGSTGRSP